MIEGVIAANQLAPLQSDRLRNELWVLCGVDSAFGRDDSGAIARVA